MSKKIFIDLNQIEVEEILQDSGYGIRPVGESIMDVAAFVNDKFRKMAIDMIENRIQKLEKIKAGSIMQIDDFLKETKLFKTARKYFKAKTPPWTPKKRIEFIEKQWGLEKFVQILESQIEKYSSIKKIYEPKFKDNDIQLTSIPLLPVKIMPITLLTLVWSNSMTSGRKKDWQRMQELMIWFAEQLKKFGITNIFCTDGGEIPSSESLRKYYNTYNGTEYEFIASVIHMARFGKKEDKEEELHKPILEEMKDYFLDDQYNLNEWIEKIDFMAINADMLIEYGENILSSPPST